MMDNLTAFIVCYGSSVFLLGMVAFCIYRSLAGKFGGDPEGYLKREYKKYLKCSWCGKWEMRSLIFFGMLSCIVFPAMFGFIGLQVWLAGNQEYYQLIGMGLFLLAGLLICFFGKAMGDFSFLRKCLKKVTGEMTLEAYDKLKVKWDEESGGNLTDGV